MPKIKLAFKRRNMMRMSLDYKKSQDYEMLCNAPFRPTQRS